MQNYKKFVATALHKIHSINDTMYTSIIILSYPDVKTQNIRIHNNTTP